ncbi:hypothetical protein [uncultured Dokdonia sp.]|uniref:hypothetical protein n=1 Tax=uncultured Dokdonia sp. TaxID=575653 RepID=UPI00260CA908|nr:hypothetical protein [uncultured Dokdonia sp.]
MKQKLVYIYFLTVFFYSCDTQNIDGHWHIIEVTEEDKEKEEIFLVADEMPSEFYDFQTFDISDQKGVVNQSSTFLRTYEISQDTKNKELIIHTDSAPIKLTYALAPWIVDNEDLSDTDTLYLFSKETNRRYRGYRDQDTMHLNHIYDPLNMRKYSNLKIPVFSDISNLKIENHNIQNSHLIIFPNGPGKYTSPSSKMIIANRIASNDLAEETKDNIRSIVKDIENQEVKVFIDGRYQKKELKKLLQTLLSVGAKGMYISIKKVNKETIHWIEASTLLAFIIQSEKYHLNLKIWDAVDLQ